MAPNLFLFAKTAVSPWKWCLVQQPASKLDKTQLYFGREPIKGIYAISSRGKRYLVAIKPNCNVDVGRIFMRRNIPACDERSELAKINNIPIQNVSVDDQPQHLPSPSASALFRYQKLIVTHILQTTVYLQSTQKAEDGTRTGTLQVTVTEKPRDSSPSSTIASTTSQTCSQTVVTTPRTVINTNSSSSSSICNKSPIIPVNKPINSVEFILKTTGALPRLKSSFGKDSHRFRRQARSLMRSSTTRISQIDLNGYRFLAKPLQVEFNDIVGRWMFSSEIRTRSIVAPVCKSMRCMKRDVSACSKSLGREMFCLDDGISWVVGGARRKAAYREGQCLFMVDWKMDCMRRQNVQELRESEKLLEEICGKVLVSEQEEEYVPLLRYLGVEFGYA
ncbi:hypothetical protein BKA65DRAFT_504680 [Rhexocercosporidium sp. MPI-PUGE-AT-0058]|nr:hypothetical protein BKA65DRAFT_504680 [Rhexocercosporidium sp. MPI-PUGE-AT-0058]